jgi:hypothetical protein
LWKNGVEDMRDDVWFPTAASEPGGVATALTYLNGDTDYVEARVYAQANVTLSGAAWASDFSAELVGQPRVVDALRPPHFEARRNAAWTVTNANNLVTLDTLVHSGGGVTISGGGVAIPRPGLWLVGGQVAWHPNMGATSVRTQQT